MHMKNERAIPAVTAFPEPGAPDKHMAQKHAPQHIADDDHVTDLHNSVGVLVSNSTLLDPPDLDSEPAAVLSKQFLTP